MKKLAGIGQHLCGGAQYSGKDTERTVVTHFQELADRKCAGLTETVDAESGKSHDDPHRSGKIFPEAESVSGLIADLDQCHQGDDSERGLHSGNGNNVSPGDSAGGKIVGDAVDVVMGIKRKAEDECQRQKSNEPVYPMHFITSSTGMP